MRSICPETIGGDVGRVGDTVGGETKLFKPWGPPLIGRIAKKRRSEMEPTHGGSRLKPTEADASLFSHGGEDGNEELLAIGKLGLDLVAELSLGDLDVLLHAAVGKHKRKESIVDIEEGVFLK